MRTETAKPVRLEDYRPTDYAIPRVELDIVLEPEATVVTATLAIEPRAGTAAGAPLRLDGDELEFLAAAIDGRTLTAAEIEAGPQQLVILAPPAGAFSLVVTTRIAPASNTKLMGLFRTSRTYCTQCEPEGFRRITYFIDRPDVLSVYTTRISAARADAPLLLANGNLIESGDIAGTDRHFAVWHDPFPKPAYLYAMVAGDLAKVSDSFTTASGRKVALEIYVEHGKQDRVDYAMDALKRSMRWDEEAFGREYDLDVFMVVAVSDFNMGAMENKGLNVFNDKYVLAKPDTATDVDYAGIESVIAHEYFHNWTGNRITCRDWFQLCLKEGLTVFRDQEFSSDQRSRPVKRIADVRLLKAHQFPEDAGPLAHPVRPKFYHEINNFYTATVYEKGSEVVRMIKTWLGAEAFRAGMNLYFDRHDGEAATIEQFLAAFADANGVDMSQFMRWYEQSGTPELTATGSWDAATLSYRLVLEQTLAPTPGQATKQPQLIPVRYGLVGPSGTDMVPTAVSGIECRGDVLSVVAARHEVVFEGIGEKPVPSLLRGFSAPVKLTMNLSAEEQLFLLGSDSDAFNRWQAAQVVATRLLVARSAKGMMRGTASQDWDAFIHAMGQVLRDDRLDPAFRALALTLPTEADIAREIGSDVDPDAIATARDALRRAIGTQLHSALADTYAAMGGSGAYSPDAASAGRRALRNICLDHLAMAGSSDGAERVARQFHDADNMTDRFAALQTAVMLGLDGADKLLAAFHARFAGDALVLDKWFSVQAMAPLATTLDKVKALTGHEAFSMSNPNRIRSLVGSFATGNQTQFNRIDGAGYGFVAGIVTDLDSRNPQVAARMLSAFRSWRALEPGRRALAEAQLRQIAARDGLSPDVADIVQRCLQ
ncbi:MAG: aminopeptidase N [Hyphomicrobiaceae bacterium]|nr:aminopeptidase N [Hyphomicrobiaceae bacterium]